MQEYRILRQNGTGKPFSLWTYSSFEACYCKLLELVDDCSSCVHKDYYVFNDFYENEFFPSANYKFKIECREVGKWKSYSNEKNIKKYNKITKIY